MYMYDEIQLHEKKYAFLHSLPLTEFKRNGIVLGADIIEKHQRYLADALEYAKDNCDYLLEDANNQNSNGYYIIQRKHLEDQIAKVLLIDPDTEEEVRKNLVKNHEIALLLKWVKRRSYYTEQREHLLTCAAGLTQEERDYMIKELDESNDIFRRYELDTINPRLNELFEKMTDEGDRPEDYKYWELWNGKHFHTIFTKEQQTAIFKRLAHYVSDETMEMLRTQGDIMFNEHDLYKEISEHRTPTIK